jgi:hypothetical protein
VKIKRIEAPALPALKQPVTPPEVQAAIDYKEMVRQVVEERLAEVLAASQAADLEPFFQPKEIAAAIRRKQTVLERSRWTFYFEDYGCLICGSREAKHQCLGMCPACVGRTRERLKAAMRLRESTENPEVRFRDTVQLAREALMPSIEKLAAKRKERQ